MKRLHYFIILFILCLLSFINADDKDKIQWSADYRLKWQDFQGKPDYNYEGDALTSSGILYESSYDNENKKFHFNVICYFEKKKSWVKKDKNTDYLLNHEQVHFDITEVFARRLKKELGERTFTTANVKREVSAIYNRIMKEWTAEENLYDKETKHSKIKEKQKEWNLKVANQLEETE